MQVKQIYMNRQNASYIYIYIYEEKKNENDLDKVHSTAVNRERDRTKCRRCRVRSSNEDLYPLAAHNNRMDGKVCRRSE